MTEKRIREIAAKMWVAYNQPDWSKVAVKDFRNATEKEKWLAAARIAVSELQRCPKTKKLSRWPKRSDRPVKPHACRIGPGGKRTCK